MRTERLGLFRAKYSDVRILGDRANKIVDEVVREYIEGLDEFVKQAEVYMEKLRTNSSMKMDDELLQRMVVRLPILMYHLIDPMDKAGIDADIAASTKEIVLAHHYLEAEGTIKEREASATLKAADETLIVDLSKHAHQRIKKRIDVASDLFDSLRKVMSARDTEKQVFKRDR